MGDGVYTHIEINDLISVKIQTYSFGKLLFIIRKEVILQIKF